MAKLIVHNPPTVKLKASGYTGTPTGDIELTENNRTYNVSSFATATVKVPIGIPIDEGSQIPLYFGVHASGFVLSSNPADETPVAFGVNANGHPYVKGGTA